MAKIVKGLEGIDTDADFLKREKETLIVRGFETGDAETGALTTPIFQSAVFSHPRYAEATGYSYTRAGNPTRLALENTIAALEHGKKAWALSSGMAAISSVLKLMNPGDHMIVSEDLYGGTYRLFSDLYAKYGILVSYVDTSDSKVLKNSVRPNTKQIFIETPSNPMMRVTDIRKAAEIAHTAGAILVVDNTFLTPYFQNPLDLGADIVVHSGTKYLGGHNDVLCGFVVIRDEKWIEHFFMNTMSEGAVLGAFDSYLLSRSLKTLAVRMERHQENARKVCDFLKTHEKVAQVYYVGDKDHPSYRLSRKQSSGFGAMISFRVKNAKAIPKILSNLKLIYFAESLGGVETLMTFPVEQTHGAIPEEIRQKLGVDETLLRLSVGIEHADDIIADIDQALTRSALRVQRHKESESNDNQVTIK
ncbi:MAG: PLP-dependent aspartate aminotransferase family protein [Clostridiales Family XIII bacterium]|nr:PLP-dependent aspartate aminotransferase family protein [Clostridiales Family XIII bacterium]